MAARADAARTRELGIILSANTSLKIDWRKLTQALGEVLSGGFLAAFGVQSGPFQVFGGLLKAATSIEASDDPSEHAWLLLVLCFSWAVDELKTTRGATAEELKSLAKQVVKNAKEKLKEKAYILPADFVSRPTKIPLYESLRDQFIENKAQFRSGINESDAALKHRFDTAFRIALFEVWARRPSFFSSILLALDPRISSVAQFEVQWEAYRDSLLYAFHVRPIFGQEEQKLSLAQVHVPLRALWKSPSKEELEHDGEKGAETDEKRHIVSLQSELDAWLKNGADDYLRIIGGGPGSGKSTSLRAFAAGLAKSPEWRPLFIPLQHIDIRGDFRANIERYFVDRTNGPFSKSPIDRLAVEGGAPLVLIFDGLDELSTPGDAAKDVANLFVSKLTQLISDIRGDDGHVLKVVLSGRLPSFQAVKRYLSAPGRKSLEVQGFTPISERVSTGKDLAERDQRPIWWKRYAALTGEQAEIPPAFKDSRLQEVSGEPLLCYLLVLSRFALEDWEAAADNRNRIYERLINEVWRRGWGDGTEPVKRRGPGKNLTRSNFNVLMETIAHAAWLGGDTRTCSEEGFREAIRINKCEQAWAQFSEDSGPDVANLAMNFYLKAADKSHRGFEFTHKSFGDYLAARAIIKQACASSDFADSRIDIALQDWFTATSNGIPTLEIINFIRDEWRLQSNDEGIETLLTVKRAFIKMENEVIRSGFPQAGVQERTFRGLQARQRNAEAALWMVMAGAAHALAETGHMEESELNVEWIDESSFGELLDRLAAGTEFRSPMLACFECVVARDVDLFGRFLSGVNFRRAKLRGASFNCATVMYGDFRQAELVGTVFMRSSLDGANFDGANVGGANFSDAHIGGTNLLSSSNGSCIVSELALAMQGRLTSEDYVAPSIDELSRIKFQQFDVSNSGEGILARIQEITKLRQELESRSGESEK